MNFQTIKWTIILSLIAVAYWKIFGRNGVIVSVCIAALLLFLIYTYQNKLLYMPGNIDEYEDIPNAAHSPKDNPSGWQHPSDRGMNT